MKQLKILETLLGFIIIFALIIPLGIIWGDSFFWFKIEATLVIVGIFIILYVRGVSVKNFEKKRDERFKK